MVKMVKTTLILSYCLFLCTLCDGAWNADEGRSDDDVDSMSTLPDRDPETKNSTDISGNENITVTEEEINTTDRSTNENGEDASNTTIDTSGDIHLTGISVSEEINSTVYDYDVTTLFVTSVDGNEANRTACWSNPCRNGGTCVEDDVIPTLFSCVCRTGYVGIRCGTRDACVEGHKGELCEQGACVYSKDGLERSCHCFTGTFWDEERRECREPDPPCFPSPCMNGGTCWIKPKHENEALCDCPTGFQGNNCSVENKCGENCEKDKKGKCVPDEMGTTKYCRCVEGWYWNEEEKTCKEMLSPCDSSPCQNGGACDTTSETEYNCSCELGFSGRTCEVIEKCSTHEDCVHGACVLSQNKTMKTCVCNKGFYLEEWSHKCEEITSACQPNPCQNDGICTILSNGAYNCTCSYGYTGPKCDVRDLCKMDGGEVFCANGQCSNNFQLGVYYCTCEGEEYFQYNERKCVDLDLCPLMQCDSKERCQMGKFECRENYKYNNDTRKCEPDFCSSDPCPLTEMICKEGTGIHDYTCSCQEGFAFNGTHCNEAFCTFPGLNKCDQICSTEEKGYKCSCEDDFELKEDNHTCLYTGNYTCLSNKTCEGGICVQKSDEEVCLCPPGYLEVEGKCADVCSSKKLNSGICPLDECEITKEGGFKCKCEGKFSLSTDGATCTVRNVCQEQEIGWKTCTQRNAKCVEDWESSEGFKCECGWGQIRIKGGICRDVCSLEDQQRQCSIKGATCDVDPKGIMICRCPPYFKENEGDHKCTQPADFSYLITLPLDKTTYEIRSRMGRSANPPINDRKISNDITVTLGGMFQEFTRANILSYKFSTHSDTILCKAEIQFTTDHGEELKRLATEETCLSNGNSKNCLIPPSLVMVKDRIKTDVFIQPTDPCDEYITDIVCGSETTCTSSLPHKSFNCTCKPGFYSRRKNYPFGNAKSFIEICADIDECGENYPCPANSICTNTIGSYTCSCKPGYRNVGDEAGSSVQKCVEICSPNPCTHGECSRKGDHEFDCRCDPGYRGSLCNLQDENFKRAKTNTIIVGVVLGGILLTTFILFAVCVSRLRKKKTLENAYYNSTEMSERRQVECGAINNAFQRE